MPGQSLLSTANTLKLEDDLRLLKALAEAVRNFGALKVHIAGLADVTDLLNRIAQGLDQAAIQQAFAALGLQSVLADLVELIGKITDLAHRIPPEVVALLSPLSAVASADDPKGLVAWNLATPAKPAIKTDRYTVDLRAGGGVSFDAFATFPDDAASPRLLLMEAHGGVTGSVNASVPFSLGTFSAGGDAAISVGLGYFFAADTNELFAAAVARRLGELPDPFDYRSVWAAFHDVGLGLNGMNYSFVGSAHAQVQVAVADAFQLSGGATSALALNVGVSASLDSTYRLTLRQAAGGAIAARLSRKKVSEDRFTLELKLDADLSALTAPVIKAMDRFADKWADALQTIRPFLSPGTLLRDKLLARLTTLVHDDDLRPAILADIKGALGVGDLSEPDIVDWLEGKVTGALNQGSVLVDGQLDKAVDRVVAQLVKALPVLAKSDPGTKLKKLIAEQVADLDAALAKQVTAIFNAVGKKLKDALKAAGADVSGAVNSADGLLKPVRDLLKKFDDELQRILTVAKAKAEEKAHARLYAEETTRDELGVEIAGVFTAVEPSEAEAVFRALTRGKLQALVQIVDKGDVAGFDLTESESFADRFSSFKSRQGTEISFLGLELNYQELVEASADIRLDGDGDLHVDDRGSLKKILSLGSDREVSFVDAAAIVLTKAMRTGAEPPGRPTLNVGVGAAYAEKTLERKDVAQFADSLVQAGLATAIAVAGALAAFDRWDAADSGKVKADIAADLRLDGDQAERLMRLGRRDAATHKLTLAGRIEVAKAGFAALSARHAFDAHDFAAGLAIARGRFHVIAVPADTAEVMIRIRDGISVLELPPKDQMPDIGNTPPVTAPGDLTGQGQYVVFLRECFGLANLVDLVDLMGQVYLAAPAPGEAPGQNAAWFRDRQHDMVGCSRTWLTVFKDVVNLFTAKITPRTLAFMSAMTDLAGPGADGQPARVKLTLTHRPAGAASESLEFR